MILGTAAKVLLIGGAGWIGLVAGMSYMYYLFGELDMAGGEF